MGLYDGLLRQLLFRVDAERAHDAAIQAGRLAGVAPMRWLVAGLLAHRDPRLEITAAGRRWSHPLGLAAGFDKNGVAVDGLAALGFSHVEIGSVSADPSAGNPRPRLFRLPADEAIVVHYGLPNHGAERIARRLAARRRQTVLGANVVKTNRGPDAGTEPAAAIVQDYVRSVRALHDHADYIMLNLSCPNTENGRNYFADGARVEDLLLAIQETQPTIPVFLKVAPLGGTAVLDELLRAAAAVSVVAGFAFNLAPGKPPGLSTPAAVTGPMPGALAGRPVRNQMDQRIRELYRRMDRQRYIIVGIGGVFTAADAYRKIRAGATLVQLLSALIYRGPGVVRQIRKGLGTLLERDGLSSIQEAVGLDAGC
jgi:dihydroorotate dehydrogenase